MVKSWVYKNLKGDPIIWFVIFALSVLSILVVYSATGTLAYRMMGGDTEYYLIKHTFLLLLSLCVMWVAHLIDYRYYARISRIGLWISLPLLIITWKFGINIHEASRWLNIPIIDQAFQPSDLAKLALIANLASMLAKRQQKINDLKESLIPILLWCGTICGLIGMTNLSTASLLFATCILLMFIGRVPVKYLVMLMFVGVLAGTIAITLGQRGNTAINRIENFISNKEPSFQAQQSYIAIATGGITGKGPGQSDQRTFLPHPYSDFIYAIVIEEYGFIGGVTLLGLYLILLYRGMKAAADSDRAFGGLLAAGLSFAIVVQAMINMGVAVGLGPITGLPLPLVSMGGTSMLFTGASLGIIQSVIRSNKIEEYPEEEKGNPEKIVVNQ